MRRQRWSPTSILPLVLTALLAPAPVLAQGLTPEQVLELESVSDVALSPDGSRVAYTVSRARNPDEDPGGSWSNLYVISVEGGEPTALVEGSLRATAPVWTRDGRHVLFRANLDAHDRPQVYRIPASGGQPEPITRSPTGVSSFAPAPAGGLLAYTASVPAMDEAEAPGDDEVVWSRKYRHARLWIQPPEGEAYAITGPETSVRSFAWAPDGRRLALQTTESPSVDAGYMYRRLHTVAAGRGAEPRPLTDTRGKLGDMAWSPDGLRLAFLGAVSFNDPLAQSVFVVSAQGGRARNLTGSYQGSGTQVFWLDGETVGFVAQEGTKATVNRVPVAGGRIQRVAGGGDEIFSSISLDRDGERFATDAETARHPEEVYVGSLDDEGGELRRVTEHNDWLAGVELGRQETIEWTGPDGLRIQGVLIHPVNEQEGRRYPLAVLPHGGPEGINQDGWSTRALYPAQVLAGRGYAVLHPNYRGSAGRGVAFSKADHRDLGGEEFLDVLAGIDHLAETGLVDPQRVGISGTSYGGYFSAWAATKHADRFKVAIPFAGLTNMTAFMGTTDIPVEMSAVHFDLWWFDNPGIYWDRSPIAHVSESSTPTLIGHGLADERVHPEQSLELYTALDLKGVPTELVYYPREPHGLNERAHQLDFMRRILEWMDRYLKDGAPVSQ